MQSLCVQGFGPVSVEILSATRAASAPRFTRFTRLQPPKQGLLAPFGFGREAGIGLTGRKLRSRSSADLCHNACSKAAAKAAPLQPTSQAAPPVQPPSQAAPPVPAPMQPVESDSYMDNQEIERLAHAACAGRAEADMFFDLFLRCAVKCEVPACPATEPGGHWCHLDPRSVLVERGSQAASVAARLVLLS